MLFPELADYQALTPFGWNDFVLGCVSFDWYDDLSTAKMTVPRNPVINQPTYSSYTVHTGPPDAIWDSALLKYWPNL